MDIGQKLFYWICKQAESLIKDLLCKDSIQEMQNRSSKRFADFVVVSVLKIDVLFRFRCCNILVLPLGFGPFACANETIDLGGGGSRRGVGFLVTF